ncbi:hypothetical protein R3P38DRAFT_2758644 [Favolaschia claudopus]|uniref:Uncharacterized protein n=1 Tax=Favolaschia claudopus TaxID=2862362 RepID=A0AAW0EBF1_9AGAR
MAERMTTSVASYVLTAGAAHDDGRGGGNAFVLGSDCGGDEDERSTGRGGVSSGGWGGCWVHDGKPEDCGVSRVGEEATFETANTGWVDGGEWRTVVGGTSVETTSSSCAGGGASARCKAELALVFQAHCRDVHEPLFSFLVLIIGIDEVVVLAPLAAFGCAEGMAAVALTRVRASTVLLTWEDVGIVIVGQPFWSESQRFGKSALLLPWREKDSAECWRWRMFFESAVTRLMTMLVVHPLPRMEGTASDSRMRLRESESAAADGGRDDGRGGGDAFTRRCGQAEGRQQKETDPRSDLRRRKFRIAADG